MIELVRYIVASFVDHPDAVQVREFRGEQGVVLELEAHPSDLGRVIGRQGRTAQALRAVLGMAAAKARVRVVLDILDEDGDGEGAGSPSEREERAESGDGPSS